MKQWDFLKKYKVILMDLWGTLIYDGIENINDMRSDILYKYVGKDKNYWKHKLIDNIAEYKKIEEHGISKNEVERLREILGECLYNDEILTNILTEMDNLYLNNINKIYVNPDFNEIFSLEKDVVLISNSGLLSAKGTRKLLEQLGLIDKFKQIYLSSECKFCKPNELFYLLPLIDMKLNIQDVIMIGDNIEKDIIPCKKLNIDTYWIKYEKF